MAQAFSRPTLDKVIEQLANRRYDELEFVRLSDEWWRDLESCVGQWTKDQSLIGGSRLDPRGEVGIAHLYAGKQPDRAHLHYRRVGLDPAGDSLELWLELRDPIRKRFILEDVEIRERGRTGRWVTRVHQPMSEDRHVGLLPAAHVARLGDQPQAGGKISRGTNQASAPCLGTAPGIPEPQPVVRLAQACSTFFCSAALPGGEIGVEQLRV